MLSSLANAARTVLVWEDAGGVTVVQFKTRALRDEQEINRLFGQVESLVGERACRVVLDFAPVEAFASYSIGRLVGLHRRLHARGGRLALCGLSPAVRKLLDTMRLDRLFNVYETEQDALQSF